MQPPRHKLLRKARRERHKALLLTHVLTSFSLCRKKRHNLWRQQLAGGSVWRRRWPHHQFRNAKSKQKQAHQVCIIFCPLMSHMKFAPWSCVCPVVCPILQLVCPILQLVCPILQLVCPILQRPPPQAFQAPSPFLKLQRLAALHVAEWWRKVRKAARRVR
jgi:hypothetical protein